MRTGQVSLSPAHSCIHKSRTTKTLTDHKWGTGTVFSATWKGKGTDLRDGRGWRVMPHYAKQQQQPCRAVEGRETGSGWRHRAWSETSKDLLHLFCAGNEVKKNCGTISIRGFKTTINFNFPCKDTFVVLAPYFRGIKLTRCLSVYMYCIRETSRYGTPFIANISAMLLILKYFKHHFVFVPVFFLMKSHFSLFLFFFLRQSQHQSSTAVFWGKYGPQAQSFSPIKHYNLK